MKPTKIYKPFSILVVPFPFTDSSQKKKRPALVVSSKTYQKEADHISLLMITSSLHSEWYGDYQITELGPTNLKSNCASKNIYDRYATHYKGNGCTFKKRQE